MRIRTNSTQSTGGGNEIMNRSQSWKEDVIDYSKA
jgi:hypothetical protein